MRRKSDTSLAFLAAFLLPLVQLCCVHDTHIFLAIVFLLAFSIQRHLVRVKEHIGQEKGKRRGGRRGKFREEEEEGEEERERAKPRKPEVFVVARTHTNSLLL